MLTTHSEGVCLCMHVCVTVKVKCLIKSVSNVVHKKGGDSRHCGDRGYKLGKAFSHETPLLDHFYISYE